MVEITLVSTDPPRASWLAHWSVSDPIEQGTESIDLLRPPTLAESTAGGATDGAAGTVTDRAREVGGAMTGPVAVRPTVVRRLSIQHAIELTAELLGQSSDLDEGHPFDSLSPSAQFVATTIAVALDQVARGAIQPGLTPSGIDCWRPAGHGQELTNLLASLADACPPALRCAEWSPNPHSSGSGPSGSDLDNASSQMLTSPDRVVDELIVATIDRFPRTAAASTAAGHEAFADLGPSTIDPGAAARTVSKLIGDREPLLTMRLRPTAAGVRADLTLQSREDADLVAPLAEYWRTPASFRATNGRLEGQLSATLGRAARVWPRLAALTETPTPSELMLDDQDIALLLGPLGRRLGAVGLSVITPPDLFPRLELTPTVAAAGPARNSPLPDSGEYWTPPSESLWRTSSGHFELSELLELKWESSFDGIELTEDELNEIVEHQRTIVRLRDRWVRLDPEQLSDLARPRSLPPASALAAALGAPVIVGSTAHHVDVAGTLAELSQRLNRLSTAESLPEPTALKAELRPYQRRGLAWLVEMADLALGGILADDMGLGKTVQVIALQLHLLDRAAADFTHEDPIRGKPASDPLMLVVCPASVIGNWQRELERFAPSIEVVRFHGTARDLGDLSGGQVVLTTYGIMRRDARLLGDIDWAVVVADEAQAMKNATSRTAAAMRTLRCRARFALTGTPVQNHLLDLWALLDWTTPGLLGTAERFRRDFVTPIERSDSAATDDLSRLLRPFLLRRRKTDPEIAPDLPAKTETDEIVPLTVEQAALYRVVVEETMAEIAQAQGIGRQGLVLKLVTRLKQVCNHPVQVLGADGGTDPGLAGRSGKLDRAVQLIEEIIESGEACLVFTQYVAMGELLQRHFDELGFGNLFYHGGLSTTHRDELVERFQRGDAPVFIISLRAGGTGLNLTAATHVIHFDRWWNPAIEDQASDRAWRIGQDRPVQVHRLISEGTIEDRIAILLNEKRQMAETVIGSGEAWISRLDDDELAALVALGADDEQAEVRTAGSTP